MGKDSPASASSKDPNRSFGFLLQDVARLLRRNVNRRFQTLGLTQAQWQALANISCREGLNQAALADIMESQPITIARLIDRMEAAGWVERRPDPNDRRAVQLHLMPKAQPIIDQMWALAAEVRAEATSGITDEEKEQLIDILLRMRSNLSGN
jgi:DNA-binding MarR family transcriptional regulator